ncbi:DUF21 domain-containing protein At1g55930, chloroplastic-like isoform X2 [Camellia sinensis]|uniref:DUF21 domain-containing protein At1g55930, chloroplastic-like isoform X2 n=1 Tax=Camellia sinensis TaxID=4442 RepID=UPI00103563E8|nr:DUF21 domain-containing protein At1g55930, chloroplastic-like isoform X2 [Camellia sinensis]
MEVAAESALLNPSTFFPRSSPSFLAASHPQIRLPTKNFPSNLLFSSRIPTNCIVQYARNDLFSSRFQQNRSFVCRFQQSEVHGVEDSITSLKLGFFVNRRIIVLAATVIGVLVFGCRRVFAVEEVVDSGYGVIGQNILLLKSYWPKLSQVLRVFKEQGLVLAALLGLSAFFSMAETSITTLWPWKVRELAEKESEDGVFKMLSIDVTRFLTTILIGTTVVNIGATALVTKAATTIFGEVGVSAATGVMTVAVLLLTEITPKSIAVHNATEVARFVVRPVAWLSLILYPVGRVVTYLSMGMLKMLGLKGRSEPYVTEDELKLMLRGAELSGTIEEEEQDMIENVLEIKDTHVREVMTPLVDVVAIDASATLVDFHHLWVTHQYSRVPVFEQRVDNIVGIAYAMDLLDSVQKIVTLEDVVEEIVGEIFDENDSKEEIQKKTGYIVMRADGIYDVDANTSIDQLSEDLNIKMPEGHQYETVSGFICEAFGYIPRTGETIKVVLEKADQEEHDEYTEAESDRQDEKEKHQNFKLEILAGNCRKVSAVRFEQVNYDDATLEVKEVTRLFPKIMKRKWSSNEDADKTDDYEEVPHEKRADDDDLSADYIINEHENDHDEHPCKQ